MQLEVIGSQQAFLFAQACLLGVALGVVYDIFRILRIAVKTNTVVAFIEDLLFFIIATAATFMFLLLMDDGRIRWYPFLGEALGFMVYYFTLGRLVMKISKIIITFIKAVFRTLFRIFIYPFVVVFRWIYKKLHPIYHKVKIKKKNVQNKVKYSLKKQRIMVYNLMHKAVAKKKAKKRKKGINGNGEQEQKKKRKKI